MDINLTIENISEEESTAIKATVENENSLREKAKKPLLDVNNANKVKDSFVTIMKDLITGQVEAIGKAEEELTVIKGFRKASKLERKAIAESLKGR